MNDYFHYHTIKSYSEPGIVLSMFGVLNIHGNPVRKHCYPILQVSEQRLIKFKCFLNVT